MGSSPFCGGSHVPRDVLSDSPAPRPPPSLCTHRTAASSAQATGRRRLPLRGDRDILQSPSHGAYMTTSGENEGEGTEEEYEEEEEEGEEEDSDCDVSIIGIIQTPQPNGLLRERCGAQLPGDTDTPLREESPGFVGAAPRGCQLGVGASAADGRSGEFPELTKEMVLAVTEASRGVDPDEVVSRHGPHCVTRQDLNTLSGTSWLNDKVIDFYLSLLTESGSSAGVAGGAVPVYAFTTFFYTRLRDCGPASVRRWTKRVDLFAFRILLVPVHHGSHWCLIVIDVCKKRITYYDPLGSSNTAACHDLLRYLCEESEVKRGRPLAPQDWAVRGCVAPGLLALPRQSGHDDCGVFVCQLARGVARGLGADFGQQHMPYFRWRMAWEILHARLL